MGRGEYKVVGVLWKCWKPFSRGWEGMRGMSTSLYLSCSIINFSLPPLVSFLNLWVWGCWQCQEYSITLCIILGIQFITTTGQCYRTALMKLKNVKPCTAQIMKFCMVYLASPIIECYTCYMWAFSTMVIEWVINYLSRRILSGLMSLWQNPSSWSALIASTISAP